MKEGWTDRAQRADRDDYAPTFSMGKLADDYLHEKKEKDTKKERGKPVTTGFDHNNPS